MYVLIVLYLSVMGLNINERGSDLGFSAVHPHCIGVGLCLRGLPRDRFPPLDQSPVASLGALGVPAWSVAVGWGWSVTQE